MPIQTLIKKRDTSELVGDQIAKILLLEQESQAQLARAAGEDAAEWDFRVYREASNPWQAFLGSPGVDEAPDEPEGWVMRPGAPVVNVSFDSSTFNKSASDQHRRQQATGTYFVDCYAHRVSGDDGGMGHESGDELARVDAQRMAALARNILCASIYYQLGFPSPKNGGMVAGRWVTGLQTFQIHGEHRAVQRIGAVRLTLEVSFYEESPEYEGAPLEIVSITLKRLGTNQVLLSALYGSGAE